MKLAGRRSRRKLRALSAETKEVARLYFQALDSSSLKNGRRDLNMSIHCDNYGRNEINNLFVAKIEGAFRRLDLESRRIINNDFFFNNYKFWWVELYSTSTYYRLKRIAMCHFLNYLD
jgi:hypothetical protein